MKSISPVSGRALNWLAGLIVIAGILVGSPSGAFLAFSVGGVLTLFSTAFGVGRTRVVAAVLLVLSVFLAVGKYPEFKREQEQYRARTKAT